MILGIYTLVEAFGWFVVISAAIVFVMSNIAGQPKLVNKNITVTINDPALEERVRNLKESQDLFNASIMTLSHIQESIQHEIDATNSMIETERTWLANMIATGGDRDTLKMQYESSTKEYAKKLDTLELKKIDIQSKIEKYINKSNMITIELDEIGHEVYQNTQK